jgi:hypothetical protein
MDYVGNAVNYGGFPFNEFRQRVGSWANKFGATLAPMQVSFHSISFPSEWGAPTQIIKLDPRVNKLPIQLVFPASGECRVVQWIGLILSRSLPFASISIST